MCRLRLFVLILCFAALASSVTAAESNPMPYTVGNFFVGHQPYPMYVEYFFPAKLTHKTPIVLIHGGAATGAGYVTTPDEREGWAIYFVSHGWKTYVVDSPGHGRSPMPEEFPTMSLRRIVEADVELVKKIGRAVFIVHSMGGMIGWKLTETVPDKVAAIVGIAPAGPANLVGSYVPTLLKSFGSSKGGRYVPEGRPVWYDRSAAKEHFANSSLFPTGAFDAFYASMVPESPHALNEILNKDGKGLSVDPKKFVNVSKLIITADQDPRHTRAVDEPLARFLGAEFIYLADVGMSGHGHMMMLEKDNQKVAQLIIDWLGKKGL